MVEFTTELVDFARGERRGIRNPFVIVPAEPAIERRLTHRLEQWTVSPDGRLDDWEDVTDTDGTPVTVTSVRLDELLPETTAFQTSTELGPLDRVTTDSVEGTLKRNLASELIDRLIQEHIRGGEILNERVSVLLLLNLGSLYPFTRASELLDELDRKNVNTTVGIPFPGKVIGGRLSFFNEGARHYYPAHRIDEKISEGYMTDV
jgi:(2Fe-2S) ferredoxin